MSNAASLLRSAPRFADAAAGPLAFLDPITLAGKPVPERQWMVPEWMPMRQTTALYGDGGTGKSLLAQQLMTACAIGRPWLGLDVRQCKAFGVFCEDENDELHIRQHQINQHYEVDFGDLEAMRWASRVGDDNTLMEFDATGGAQLTPFWAQVSDAARDFGAQLVILDTAADMFAGNELNRQQVRQFVQRACTTIAREIDGAVLLCAHPSAAGITSGDGSGGSTAWSNSVRARWYLAHTKPRDGESTADVADQRTLSRKKSNRSGRGEELRLEWSDGVFQVHGTTGPDMVDRIDRHARERMAEDAFLHALRNANKEGRGVSESANASKSYAPKVFAARPECAGFTWRELEDAMNRLFYAGRLMTGVRVGTRSARRGVFSLGEVEPGKATNDNQGNAP